MPTRKPYGDTAVPAERSMGAIFTMLRARAIDGRWSEHRAREAKGEQPAQPAKVILQLLWEHEGATIGARIEVAVKPPEKPARSSWGRSPIRTRSPKPPTDKQIADALDNERKRILRVLSWWLKSQFEAVDAGLLTTVEVMLPFLEVGGEGSPTVADLLKQHAGALGRGPGSLVRALSGGAK
jgi:hypothetical protein